MFTRDTKINLVFWSKNSVFSIIPPIEASQCFVIWLHQCWTWYQWPMFAPYEDNYFFVRVIDSGGHSGVPKPILLDWVILLDFIGLESQWLFISHLNIIQNTSVAKSCAHPVDTSNILESVFVWGTTVTHHGLSTKETHIFFHSRHGCLSSFLSIPGLPSALFVRRGQKKEKQQQQQHQQ